MSCSLWAMSCYLYSVHIKEGNKREKKTKVSRRQKWSWIWEKRGPEIELIVELKVGDEWQKQSRENEVKGGNQIHCA